MTCVLKHAARRGLDLSLYLIMDAPSFACRKRLLEVAQSAVEGGVKAVQLRDFKSRSHTVIETFNQLRSLVPTATLHLNTQNLVEVAKKVDAAGVFLEKERDYQAVRKALGEEVIIGMGVDSEEEVKALKGQSAIDYISVKILASQVTNPDSPDRIWGYEGLSHMCREADHPVLGVGGVGLGNVKAIYRRLRPGDGVAVAGEITRSSNPKEVARTIQQVRAQVREEKQ